MSELFRRLRFYFRRHQFEAELDEEMQQHAALAGRPQFGNITLLKEDSRAMWTWTFWDRLGQDLRYAVRAIANNRTFTALAALSLALGIGANTAIYSFMDAILLRSLPVQDPDSLVMLNWHGNVRGAPGPTKGGKGPTSVMHMTIATSGSTYNDPKTGFNGGIFPYPAFELFRKNDVVFSSVFGYLQTGNLNLTIRGQADLAAGEYVTGDYFRGLGVPPAAGRLLLPDDDRAGAAPVAVISAAFSQGRFGGGDAAVGQSILINKVSFTVVGVTPPEFFGVDPAVVPDFYLPMHANLLLDTFVGLGSTAQRYLDPNAYWVEVMGRLRPGVNLAQALAALAPPFHRWVDSTASNDQERADLPALVVKAGGGGLESLRRLYSRPLYVLLGLVGLILAIACANIANLLLARATARRREMAIRLSMGAGRLRVIRQLLTESVLLALLGGTLGVVFALEGIHFLTLLLANGRDNFTLRADLNWHVLAATIALSLLTGLLFGLAPALQSTRINVLPALKESRGEEPRAGVRGLRVNLTQILVVAQIAISLLMLVAAGLFVHTLSNLQSVHLGFNRENLLLFQLNARQSGHRDAELLTFYRDLQKQLAAVPGVRAVSLSNLSMVAGGTMGMMVTVQGETRPGNRVLSVGPSFFSTMQIPIALGREIDERDEPGSPAVAVINELFAKAAFGNDRPIGQHIAVSGPPNTPPRDLEIVGVSQNARYGLIRQDLQPVVYIAYNQGSFPPIAQMNYALRTAGDPLNYVNTVREIVHNADALVPVSYLQTQTAQIDRTINQEIIFARLCTGFAILGLLIACVGLYGTLSYNVSRRTGEIGIRMALGAPRKRVVWMILRQVVTLAAVGLALGLPIAYATSHLVESFLFGTKPNDPLAVGIAVGVLLAAAVLAGYAPARRASKIDPMTALRHE